MIKKVILAVMIMLFADIIYAQEFFIPDSTRWALFLNEDFNSPTINAQYYKDNNEAKIENNGSNTPVELPALLMDSNVYIQNGNLVIKTVHLPNPIPCPRGNQCQYGGWHHYTSGAIVFTDGYDYGFYEIYAKVPYTDGYWPAFWFWRYSITWYNEIDVFEGCGARTDKLSCNVHWNFYYNYSDTNDLHDVIDTFPCDYTTGYHWYGVRWDKSKIYWYYDRKLVRTAVNNFEGVGIHHPMNILLNVALHPNVGNSWPWGSRITANSVFPNYMYVDKLRGYHLKCTDKNTVITDVQNIGSLTGAVKKSITLTGATTIPSNASVELYATDFIKFGNGFNVPVGSTLKADICNGCR